MTCPLPGAARVRTHAGFLIRAVEVLISERITWHPRLGAGVERTSPRTRPCTRPGSRIRPRTQNRTQLRTQNRNQPRTRALNRSGGAR